MSLTNKVLYDIDQRNDTTPEQKETARKNIGAYEDKTTAGGIPKVDLSSDVQSSLGKADSSVQSVTLNGQTLTKSAAGAIDIPKATDTKWGVVQVVNELKDNQNVIPNSRVIKEAVDRLSAALQARATFWTVQEWQTQSAQPGDPSKIYYVGPKGAGNDQYDMYEWRTKTNSYVLTDESTISLDGYWHGAPDILGEDTVAPFITRIEKNADDTVKYHTCSATVGNLALPVYMDSGVITSADPHFMYPTVNESTSYEEVKRLVDAGYRPIFVPDVASTGAHTRYILTGAVTKGYGPAFVFTSMTQNGGNTIYFSNESIQTVICQNPIDDEETWVWNDRILIPNIPEPNDAIGGDVGKVLTVGEYGELYWDEPDVGNNVEVRAGTDNLHVTSAEVNDKTIFTMSADYYHSSGNYAGTYTGPGTVIVDPTTMNLESTNSAYGYRSVLEKTSKSSVSWGQVTWDYPLSSSREVNIGEGSEYIYIAILGDVRSDMEVLMWAEAWTDVCLERIWEETLTAEDLENGKHVVLPKGITSIAIGLKSDNIEGEGYSIAGYNLYSVGYTDRAYEKGELAWKDETYRYVDNKVESLLPLHTSADEGKVLTVDEEGLPEWRSLVEENYAKTSGYYPNMSVGNATNAGTATDYASSGGIADALAGKLNTNGNASDTTSTFTKASGDTSDMASGGKLSAIFTAISNFFASLKALAFKDKASYDDLSSGVQSSLDKADSALQSSNVDSAMSLTSTNPIANNKIPIGFVIKDDNTSVSPAWYKICVISSSSYSNNPCRLCISSRRYFSFYLDILPNQSNNDVGYIRFRQIIDSMAGEDDAYFPQIGTTSVIEDNVRKTTVWIKLASYADVNVSVVGLHSRLVPKILFVKNTGVNVEPTGIEYITPTYNIHKVADGQVGSISNPVYVKSDGSLEACEWSTVVNPGGTPGSESNTLYFC